MHFISDDLYMNLFAPGIAVKTIIYVKNIDQARHIIYRILDIWSRVAADCIPVTGSLKPRKQGKDGKVFTKICLNSPARLSTLLFNQIWSRTDVWLAPMPVGRVIHGMKWAGEKWCIRAWVEAGLTCAACNIDIEVPHNNSLQSPKTVTIHMGKEGVNNKFGRLTREAVHIQKFHLFWNVEFTFMCVCIGIPNYLFNMC